MAFDGRQGLCGVVDEGRDVAPRQHVGGHLADARARAAVDARNRGYARDGGRSVVHAHHDVGDVAFADHADDGVGDVHVVAQQLLQIDVARRSRRGCRIEDLLGPFFDVGVLDLVVHRMQGVESVGLLGPFEHGAQPDQFVGRAFVGHRDQDVVLPFGALLLGIVRVADGDVVGAALRGESRDGACGQNHQDRAVEHALAEQTDRLAVGRVAQDDVVAHHHGGQRRRHVGRAQAEDHRPLVAREAEGLLGEPRRDEFRRGDEHDHDGRHFEALPVAEEGAVVDEHAHSDQKEGDEDGVADEFDAVHQRRGAGDQTVEGQSREECTDDRLQSRQLGEVGAQKDHHQHEDILRNVVAALFEEPVGQQREEKDDDGDAEEHRAAEPPPEHFVHVARGHADDHGEQQQGQRVGDDRAADGYGDGLVAGDAEFADDGVGDERLRGEEPGEQDRGVDRESQDVMPGQDAQGERHAEGVEAEDEASPAVFLEIGHVHVQSREEHDVEQAGRSRENDAAVAQHEVQAVGADHRARDDEPQQIGDFEFVQQQRSREDDDQDQHEFQDRVFERQRQVYMCEQQHRHKSKCRYESNIAKRTDSAKPGVRAVRRNAPIDIYRVSLRHQI